MSYLKGKSMTDLRKNNIARIIEIVLKSGPLSRAEISTISGLTRASVSTITRELIETGLLAETGVQQENNSVGRKRKNIDIVDQAQFAIGIELGVNNIKAALIDLKGNIVKEFELPVASTSPELIIAAAVDLIKKIVNLLPEGNVLGVGIGATGLVDSKHGISINSPNLGWRNIDLQQKLAGKISLPLAIDNNVRLMALGENRFSYNWGEIPRMLFIHAGYGIGCGIILNGELYYGYKFAAGELGHTIVVPDGPLCGCGKKGCLEAVASGHAIINNYRKLQEQAGSNFDYNSIINKLILKDKKSNQAASNLLAGSGKYLGIALSNLINILAPDLVVLHGELFNSASYYNNVKKHLDSNTFGINNEISITRSKLKNRAAVLGAGALIIDQVLLGK